LDKSYGDIQYQEALTSVEKSFFYNEDSDGDALLRALRGKMLVYEGVMLCMWGRSSSTHHRYCGEVKKVNRTITYRDGDKYSGLALVQTGKWSTADTEYPKDGDSGGPVYNSGYAAGVISGSLKFKAFDNTIYAYGIITPIERISKIGLDVYY
jgi:hypothetical protein